MNVLALSMAALLPTCPQDSWEELVRRLQPQATQDEVEKLKQEIMYLKQQNARLMKDLAELEEKYMENARRLKAREEAVRQEKEWGAPETLDFEPRREIELKLETMKMDLDFENAKLEDILTYLREFSGLNIAVDETARQSEDWGKPTQFKVRNASLENVLKVLLSEFEELWFVVTPEGIRVTRVPPKIPGKVMALDASLGIVIFDLGSGDGVREGSEWSITREGKFVAKIVVDRIDRKWSSGRIAQKREDPRIGDEVAYWVVAPTLPPSGPEDLQQIRRDLDELRNQVREITDTFLPSWKGHGIAVEELTPEMRGHFGVEKGLIVRRVQPGSAADKAGLKAYDILLHLTEEALMEGLGKGAPIRYFRSGQERETGTKPR